jgi:hypothetical protein
LISFDAERDKGDKAAAWWVSKLENAKRWRPYWGDANAMHQAGVDIRAWVQAALDPRPGKRKNGLASASVEDNGWLAQIREELPITIDELPELKAQHPELETRLTWPKDSSGLVLLVQRG